MKRALVSFLFLALSMAVAPKAKAADVYHFDKSHTNIMWFASHFGFSKSMGQFMEYHGRVVLDEETPANSMVEVTIDTASIMTGLPKFDAHLKNEDFFRVTEFPTATFKSEKIEVTGESTAKVHGQLTMLGKTHPVTLDVVMNKLGMNPYNKKQTAGFTVKTTIDRSQWGIDYAMPGIPAEVEILIESELIKQD